MKLTFNPFPRNLAGFVSCMAFALTALAGIEARGAVTFDADPNQDLVRWLSSGVVVDWNSEFHMLPVAGFEDQERPEVPYLSPDDIECIANAPATEPGDFSDTNAADEGDYMEYKYGHCGRNSGGNGDPNSTPAQSADDASRDGCSTQAEDPNNADNTAAADVNKSDDESAQGEETKEMPNGEGTVATENSSQGTIDDESDSDSGTTPDYEKYYRYHYMPLDEQVGRNEGANAQDDEDNSTNPKEGVESEDDGDDCQMTDDEDSSDQTADDDESVESGAFTEAMLTIASQMADEWTGSYGMKFSDVGRLLGVGR